MKNNKAMLRLPKICLQWESLSGLNFSPVVGGTLLGEAGGFGLNTVGEDISRGGIFFLILKLSVECLYGKCGQLKNV